MRRAERRAHVGEARWRTATLRERGRGWCLNSATSDLSCSTSWSVQAPFLYPPFRLRHLCVCAGASERPCDTSGGVGAQRCSPLSALCAGAPQLLSNVHPAVSVPLHQQQQLPLLLFAPRALGGVGVQSSSGVVPHLAGRAVRHRPRYFQPQLVELRLLGARVEQPLRVRLVQPLQARVRPDAFVQRRPLLQAATNRVRVRVRPSNSTCSTRGASSRRTSRDQSAEPKAPCATPGRTAACGAARPAPPPPPPPPRHPPRAPRARAKAAAQPLSERPSTARGSPPQPACRRRPASPQTWPSAPPGRAAPRQPPRTQPARRAALACAAACDAEKSHPRGTRTAAAPSSWRATAPKSPKRRRASSSHREGRQAKVFVVRCVVVATARSAKWASCAGGAASQVCALGEPTQARQRVKGSRLLKQSTAV